jgi:MFS family permease
MLEPRHFWRDVGFNELSELYSAQLLRSLAISLVGVFTPIYLYNIGYSLRDIALFMIGWMLLRPFIDVAAAFVIARIGPKHTMLLSSFIHIMYLSMVLTIQDLSWPLLLVATVGSAAYSLHLLAIEVDFSKIKHARHGGEEFGYLVIVEKIGGVVGPLVGGLIASFVSPSYTIALAMLLLLLSSIPLFFTAEPVKTRQHITFRGLPWRERRWDFISIVPTTLENIVSIVVWPLFIGIFILGDNVFAKLGAIVALSTLSSIVFSRVIGNLIDKRKGRYLLRVGTVLNALLHLARPFVGGVYGAALIHVANEPITAAYRMPYIKGQFDVADSLKGYRIAYLSALGVTDTLARLVFWGVVWCAMGMYQPKAVLMATFLVAAVASLLINTEHFEALDYTK